LTLMTKMSESFGPDNEMLLLDLYQMLWPGVMGLFPATAPDL
jgi:hypothetical protein